MWLYRMLRIAALLVFTIVPGLSFLLTPLLFLLSLVLLELLEIAALLRGELHPRVVRHGRAQALSAGCRVGLFAQPAKPGRASWASACVAVFFGVCTADVEVTRDGVLGDVKVATPPRLQGWSITLCDFFR